MTEEEYKYLYGQHANVILHPWNYYRHKDGTWTAKDDKHDWHDYEEVERLREEIERRKAQ